MVGRRRICEYLLGCCCFRKVQLVSISCSGSCETTGIGRQFFFSEVISKRRVRLYFQGKRAQIKKKTVRHGACVENNYRSNSLTSVSISSKASRTMSNDQGHRHTHYTLLPNSSTPTASRPPQPNLISASGHPFTKLSIACAASIDVGAICNFHVLLRIRGIGCCAPFLLVESNVRNHCIFLARQYFVSILNKSWSGQ